MISLLLICLCDSIQGHQMPLSRLEALSVSKDTHTWTLFVSPPTSTTSGVVNQVCGSQRVQFIFIQAYISMAPFGLPSSPNFFLKLRERSINLILYQIFSTIFPVDMCTWKSKASAQYSVFNYCGGRRERKMGLATQLIGFFLSYDSSLLIVARDSFLFFFLLWDHCVWEEKF